MMQTGTLNKRVAMFKINLNPKKIRGIKLGIKRKFS